MQTLTESAKMWMARLGLVTIFGLAVVAAVFLSAVFFAVFLVLAVIGSVIFWWQTRRLRQRAAEVQRVYEEEQEFHSRGELLEAEYRVEERREQTPGYDPDTNADDSSSTVDLNKQRPASPHSGKKQ